MNGVRRVRIHVPPKDGMPETVRGVGSAVRCTDCGAELKGRTHAEVRKAWRMHRLEGCAEISTTHTEGRGEMTK